VKITDAQWQRVSRLLDEALEVEPALREQWLDKLAAEHSDLRDTLRDLLNGEGAGAETGDFLPSLARLGERTAAGVGAGDLVGPYRLIRELGAGGMASVWLAERADGSLRRRVALKLPRVLFSDGGLAARMARERDILAALEHPSIARLYDAGVEPDGRPYLAIEYVDGVPLDVYAREHALTVLQRLELFLQIARALAFAHGRLIVHRDLKPANILVTAAGEVRLLDFGIARLLQTELTEGAHHTQFGSRAFTPWYAAPEQFTGEPITVATDVYSLGVLLYELLAGASPYASARNTPAALEEAVLTLEPPPASSVANLADRRALRADLDNVLGRALKKSPPARYASVEAFAADIERYLEGRPVTARSPSRWYVARKFVRRNSVTLGVGAVVVCALVGGLGAALWQAREAARQRAIALERLTEAEDAGDFMSAVLIEGIQRSETVTLDELLARSESIAERSGQGDPRLRRFAVNFVAKWYISYGLYDRAERFLTRNLDAAPTEPSSPASQLLCTRAEAWANMGRRDEAVAALMQEISRSQNDPAAAAHCLFVRGRIAATERDLKGALDYSLEGQRRADEGGQRSLVERATELAQIGYAWSVNEDPDQAESYFARSLAMFAQAGRAEADATVSLRGSWGQAAINRGTPLQGLALFDEALAISKRRSPTGEPPAALAANRATVLRLLGRFDEAKPATDFAADLAARTGTSAERIYALHAGADLARRMGDYARAQTLLNQAALQLGAAKVRAQGVADNRHQLFQAQLWMDVGRFAEAADAFGHLIGNYTELGCCGAALNFALIGRAELFLARHRVDAAVADAQRALEVSKRAQGSTPYSSHTGLAWLTMGRARQARGDTALAREAFSNAVSHLAKTLGEQHPDARSANRALMELRN
jgi:serine/threonine protein kinase